jgi:hypothetical protein
MIVKARFSGFVAGQHKGRDALPILCMKRERDDLAQSLDGPGQLRLVDRR